jgi:hypothetical protein
VYSTPFFKNETLSLNWSLNKWDIRSWKYCYPFFVFKTNLFSQKTNFFYDKLITLGYTFFIVTDCIYHYKNIYFFKKKQLYTVGLIPLNVNPWLVTYPVFASSNNYLNQIFFLQTVIYSQKKALYLHFCFFKKIWFLFKYLKFKI